MSRQCEECGGRFQQANRRGAPPKYCSQECRGAAKRRYHNDPLYKSQEEPSLPCCAEYFRSTGGRKVECPQHVQNREAYAKWCAQTHRQRRAASGGEYSITGGQEIKARPNASQRTMSDAKAAGHEFVIREGGLPGKSTRRGPDEGSSTEFADLAGELDTLAKRAATHPWWSLSWDMEAKPKPKRRFDVFEEPKAEQEETDIDLAA